VRDSFDTEKEELLARCDETKRRLGRYTQGRYNDKNSINDTELARCVNETLCILEKVIKL